MSKGLFDLANYEKVIKYIKIMKLSFSLPLESPNSMPVTRDMSANKRSMIIKWLTNLNPETKLPYLGKPPAKENIVKKQVSEAVYSNTITQESGELAGKYEFARKCISDRD